MVWIKICGITNLEDALAAAELGADAVGFVFAPSKRRVSPETAKRIIELLPPGLEKIGIFVNEEVSKVKKIASGCGLTGIQLHGGETTDYCDGLLDYDLIKAFRVGSRIDWQQVKSYLNGNCVNRLLLDTYDAAAAGGTGRSFSWELAREQDLGGFPVILAGGLSSGNVARAVQITKPFGVDVSSGVERQPGKKDLRKLAGFIQNARGLL